jgi:hypothetical protein
LIRAIKVVIYLIDTGTKNIKGYSLLICLLCIVDLTERKLIRVWEDDFNSNGTVDHNKWDFDLGGDGWGM